MSYVDPFGVSAVVPSDVSYKAIALSANTVLEWPSFTTTGNTTARIIDVTPSVGSLTLSMPSALQSSTGTDILVKNVGAQTFTLLDFAGNTISTITAGSAVYVYLKDTSTVAGVWDTVAFGVGSSSVNAASLVGQGVKAIGGSLNQSHPTAEVVTSFTIAAGDRAQLYLDTSGVNVSLPTAAGIGDDFFFLLRNISPGSTTIVANGADLIDGAATVVLAPDEACIVCSSGTAWYTVGRGRSTVFAYTQLTKNVAGGANVTLSGTEAGYAILKFIGALTANINVVVPNVTAVWFVDNSTTGVYTLTVKTSAGTGVSIPAGERVILYADGVNVSDAQTVFSTSGSFTAGSASVPSITFGLDPDTGFYSASTNAIGVTAGGSSVGTFNATGFTGNAATVTTNANLTGEVTSVGNAATVTNSAVIGKVLTGYSSGAGTVSATDTILQAINKLNGNAAATASDLSAHTTDATDAHDASAISSIPSGNLAATDVQAALNELQSDIDGRASLSVAQTFTATQVPDNGTGSVSTTSTYTFDGADQIREITFTNAITVTFGAPTGITPKAMYKFMLKAGDTSARTFAWNSAYKFPSASSPLASGTTTTGAYDIITFIGGTSNTLIYDGHITDVR